MSIVTDLFNSGDSPFGQGARLLKLRFSEASGIGEDTLLAQPA